MRSIRVRGRFPGSLLPQYLPQSTTALTPSTKSTTPQHVIHQFIQKRAYSRSTLRLPTSTTSQFTPIPHHRTPRRHFSTEPQPPKPQHPAAEQPTQSPPELIKPIVQPISTTPPPLTTEPVNPIKAEVQQTVTQAVQNVEKEAVKVETEAAKAAPVTEPPKVPTTAPSAPAEPVQPTTTPPPSTSQPTSTTPPPPTSTPTPPTTPTPAAKALARFGSILLKTTGVTVAAIIGLDMFANNWRYIGPLRKLYRKYYVENSRFLDLYTYSADVVYRDELTFQLKEGDIQNNISIYQLLILKDLTALYMFLDELDAHVMRLRQRYPAVDEFGTNELQEAIHVLADMRNTITRLAIGAELACATDTDPDKFPNITNDDYITRFAPTLYKFEDLWCQTSAAKDLCENIMPQLERYNAELLVWQRKNDMRLEDPMYLSQKSVNPSALPPPTIVPEIPYDKWQQFYANYDSNVKEAQKTFITKPTIDTMRAPLSPKQEKLRRSVYRTSAKVKFVPEHDRRLEKLYVDYIEENNARATEEKTVEKVRRETNEEHRARRQKQIEARFHDIKRSEKVKAAVDRVTNRMNAQDDPDVHVNAEEMRRQAKYLAEERQLQDEKEIEKLYQQLSTESERMQRRLMGASTSEDDIAGLKTEMTQKELDVFNLRHPEYKHIHPDPLRTKAEDV